MLNILVVNGDTLFENNSANLCHLAYIRGLIQLNHNVDLLYADIERNRDYCIHLPEGIGHVYTCKYHSNYEKLSRVKKQRINVSDTSKSVDDRLTQSHHNQKKYTLKKIIRYSVVGVHGIYKNFKNKAKKTQFLRHYDYVISLSTPASSHLAVEKMLKNNLSADHWIQIWEDPWYDDVVGAYRDCFVKREENRLLCLARAERIIYVSPITLERQKVLYPIAACKMTWQPLPHYFQSRNDDVDYSSYVYGYFGDYLPKVRNIMPFYEAAKIEHKRVFICGNPSNILGETDTIEISKRLPLDDLKIIEEKANVLVMLCNLEHGQIPGKIYQYSGTKKKILFILDGTCEEKIILKNYFSQFHRYYFCENNVEDIRNAMKQIESSQDIGIINEPVDYFEPSNIVKMILESVES